MVASWVDTGEWDALYLGGKRMPGIARVEVHRPTGLEIRKSRGKKKARLVDPGMPPAELNIEIEVEPEEMEALSEAMNLLLPRGKNASQKELQIGHPAAAFFGIAMVKIGDMGSPHPAPGGSFFLSFTAIEHCPEPPKVKKPKPASNEDEEWGAVDPLIDKLKPSQTGAAQRNFSAPEDIQSFPELDGTPWSIP